MLGLNTLNIFIVFKRIFIFPYMMATKMEMPTILCERLSHGFSFRGRGKTHVSVEWRLFTFLYKKMCQNKSFLWKKGKYHDVWMLFSKMILHTKEPLELFEWRLICFVEQGELLVYPLEVDVESSRYTERTWWIHFKGSGIQRAVPTNILILDFFGTCVSIDLRWLHLSMF